MKPQKKYFLVARPLRPYPPPPSLVATFLEIFFRALKKFFFLSGQALTPPLLLVATKK